MTNTQHVVVFFALTMLSLEYNMLAEAQNGTASTSTTVSPGNGSITLGTNSTTVSPGHGSNTVGTNGTVTAVPTEVPVGAGFVPPSGRRGQGQRGGVIWEYCDGNATVPQEQLYIEPACDSTTVQKPPYNTSDVEYEAVRLSNLSFCCKANYTALLPKNTNVTELDEEAKQLYLDVKRSMIDRFDCPAFYPFHTCDPCLYAYRTWLCSVLFPLKCALSGPNPNIMGTVKICSVVCLEVKRKCPVEFGFECPALSGQEVYGEWTETTDAEGLVSPVGGGGCNRMQYSLAFNGASMVQRDVGLLLFVASAAVMLVAMVS